jgi:pyruvate dehydrogenase E2 component (dihydrolipoamide acetyltransferase)
MAIEITVPRLGWSSEDGVFSGWLKQHGETVKAGEPLFLLESDKVTMEVESLDSGTLHVLAGCTEAGGTVNVGQLLGYLLAEGEDAESVIAPTIHVEPVSQRVTPAILGAAAIEKHKGPITASPRARARAKSLGIDITSVSPAASLHRVVEADVLRVAGSKTSRTRKVIATRLEESFRTPHFYVHAEVDATAVVKLRDELRVTYNDILIGAAASALRVVPEMNAYWREGAIVQRETVDIGLAVQTQDALLVPVFRNVDRLTLAEIAAARVELVEKCRRAEAESADFEGGSLTISNLGSFGVDRFQAILNPPQSAIIAAGRIAKRPFVDGDNVVARLTLPISVSVDHRVVDGVTAAKFLRELASVLESELRREKPTCELPLTGK